jgi:predicted RNase H-like nuclease (RuvC/YqgF family)
MAFLNSIKRAFGIPTDDIDDNDDIYTPDNDETENPSLDQVSSATDSLAAEPHTEDAAATMPVELLDMITGIINESLPPLVKNSIDKESQRTMLADMLGQSFKEYVTRIAEITRSNALKAMDGDRSKLQIELDSLRSERKQLEAKRDEQKSQLLSEQRQRRALNDRVKDLEAQISAFEAERDQYQLEIKSMINKMRVAGVRESDDAELQNRIKELTDKNAGLTRILEEKDSEIADLSSRLNEAQSAQALENALSARSEMTGENADTAEEQSVSESDEPKQKRRRGRPKKDTSAARQSRQDSSDGLDDIDWMLPGGAPASAAHHQSSDPDFGYQPPQRPSFPDSDAQLTLF